MERAPRSSPYSWGEPESDAAVRVAEHAYRRLWHALRWPWWRAQLRRHADLLRSVARSDPALESLLRSAVRAGRLDALPDWRRVHRLTQQRRSLAFWAARRLPPHPSHSEDRRPLAERLLRLEEDAWRAASPQLARRGGWALAEALLPATLPEVFEAAQGARVLETCFLRPARPGAAHVPLLPAEVEAVSEALPRTERAVAVLWQRARALEPTGRLVRFLEQLARSSPRRTRAAGAGVLVHADFWCRAARSRLAQASREALPGVEVSAVELLPIVRWLVERAQGAHPPLVAAGALSEARAALIDFCATWAEAERRPARPEVWWRLEARGQRLDRTQSPLVQEAGREPLRRFVRLRGGGGASLPHEASVVGWVRTAWALSGAEPAGLARLAFEIE